MLTITRIAESAISNSDNQPEWQPAEDTGAEDAEQPFTVDTIIV